MPRQLIDLSVAIENDIEADPPGLRPSVTYLDHTQTVSQLTGFFPGLAPEDLPDREGWAIEQLTLTTHNGTHMDAPYHYHSTQDAALPSGRRPAMTIDEIPLEWCWKPGVKLDFRHFADGYVATAADIEAELARIGHALQPLDIVLVNTRAGDTYGQPHYVASGAGIGREGTLYLASRGVRIVGTDG